MIPNAWNKFGWTLKSHLYNIIRYLIVFQHFFTYFLLKTCNMYYQIYIESIIFYSAFQVIIKVFYFVVMSVR